MRYDARKLAKQNMEIEQKKMIARHNLHARHITYNIGDIVYLTKKDKKHKFDVRFRGPYEIVYVSPFNSVKLKSLQTNKQLKYKYHFNDLKKAHLRSTCNENDNDPHSQSISMDDNHSSSQHSTDNEEYLIEKVIRSRIRNGEQEYLIKWLNYPNSMNSWVKYEDLNDHSKKLADEGKLVTTGNKHSKRRTRLRSLAKDISILYETDFL